MSYYEPPEMPHYPDCENARNYYCTGCDNLILEGSKSRNWCEGCGKFIPHPQDYCTCEKLKEIYR